MNYFFNPTFYAHTVIIQHSSNTESQQSPNYLLWWLVNGMNVCVCVCGICVWPLKSLDREWIRALLASAWKKQHMSGWNDPAAAALNQSTKDLVIMICRQYTWMDRNSMLLGAEGGCVCVSIRRRGRVDCISLWRLYFPSSAYGKRSIQRDIWMCACAHTAVCVRVQEAVDYRHLALLDNAVLALSIPSSPAPVSR